MAAKILPDADVLRQLFTYDPETGEIRHASRHAGLFATKHGWAIFQGRKLAGRIATSRRNKYLCVSFCGTLYYAHRVAWKMHYGIEPTKHDLDHINGDPMDNRIVNLREASRSQNTMNTPVRSDSASGVRGVKWFAPSKKYLAHIGVNGERFHLGLFDTIQEAQKAYVAAAQKLHGEFFRGD